MPSAECGVPRMRYYRFMERECPMCGDRMRVVTRETVTKIPGTSQEVKRTTSEWVCGECDYFEEIDDEKDANAG